MRLRSTILNILTAGQGIRVDEISDVLAEEFEITSDEAFEVYMQIKDLLLYPEIITGIMQVSNITSQLKKIFSEANSIKTIVDEQFAALAKKIVEQLDLRYKHIENTFNDALLNFRLTSANLEIFTSHKIRKFAK